MHSLERIDALANQDKPFSLFIAPFAPHIGSIGQKAQSRPIPCKRHNQLFQDVKVPRTPNFNPPDVHQRDKGGWLRYLPKMTNKFINFADYAYRSRLQAIQSIDEIVEDVVAKLDEKGLLNNTYVIYTSDNGYHVGQHRVPAGKSLFFSEDTNLPFVVRGPNVPANVTSKIPGLHLDLAPTFLDIAGLNESKWPEFFDGRSLLPQWHEPLGNNGANSGKGNGKESINVEYWGQAAIEAPGGNTLGSPFWNTTYKTIRTLGEDESWLYTKWCNGDRELYNTAKDPYELTNLIPAGNHKKLEDRLNALLMVTKSCEQGSCREPWKLIQPPDGTTFTNLAQARDSKYDSFFANFARVSFNQCLSFQVEANEGPYFPAITDENVGLGRAYRKPTSGLQYKFGKRKITADGLYGTAAQRHATFAQLTDGSRKLTAEEINTS